MKEKKCNSKRDIKTGRERCIWDMSTEKQRRDGDSKRHQKGRV
jgi:hypothetical protein